MTPSFNEKYVSETVDPVSVTVVGSTGDGGFHAETTAITPGNQPNLVVQVVTPVVAILVRAINLFFVTLSGTITVSAFFDSSLKQTVILTLAVVGVGILKDCATVFTGLERRFPLASGSV